MFTHIHISWSPSAARSHFKVLMLYLEYQLLMFHSDIYTDLNQNIMPQYIQGTFYHHHHYSFMIICVKATHVSGLLSCHSFIKPTRHCRSVWPRLIMIKIVMKMMIIMMVMIMLKIVMKVIVMAMAIDVGVMIA